MTLKEEKFHALSIGNELLQKVIVLILSEFEDETDFFDIVQTMNSVVTDSTDDDLLQNQLIRIFQLSQSVFKARDAVLTKLAEEVTALKNREVDTQQAIEWFIKTAETPEKCILFILLRYGSLNFSKIDQYIARLHPEWSQTIEAILDHLVELNWIRKEADHRYQLLIHYQMD